MTYTFKLSRRIARLRALAFAALIVALTACDHGNSFDSDSSAPTTDPTAPNDESASAAFAGGIPFGTFAQPNTAFGDRFNGAMRNIAPGYLLRDLADIKSRGGKVVLMFAGSQTEYKDGSGHFSLTKWKDRVGRFKGIDFSSYVKDGTIVGHYLIDEPYDPNNWNGEPIPGTTVEEMARYSKQIWPDMVTIVRAPPTYLRGWSGIYRNLDAAWAQYAVRRGDVGAYIRENVADAQKEGLGLIVGLNLLHGGDPNLTPMSASEVESFGSALLSSSYPCAFISWQYNETYLASSSMKSAMDALRRLAQNRSIRTCRRATSSGGGTPTPPPPPPPPPAPSSAGVPFGPYGLPTSELASFSGAMRGASPGNVLGTATAARRAGARVVLWLTGSSDVANGDGTFSLTKWKAAIDGYAGVDLSSFVGDGTITGHLLVLSPEDAGRWGGQRISYATLDEMARYSRQRWPALPTIARASPSWLAANPTAWEYLDATLVTYSGAAGDAGAWVGQQAAEAREARLGLMVAMNVLNGGTSASQLPGTTAGKYAMSASQLRSWGSTLVAQSRVCGLLMARYEESYFGRSDVKEAVSVVAGKARERAATSCRTR